MPAENSPTPTSNSLINIDTTLLTLFYEDLARPGVQQVGKAIGTVLELSNVALLSIKLRGEKKKLLYTKHLEDFRKRLEGIPESEIVEVAPELGVPIVEKLGKTINEKLVGLFLNLLANASIADTAGLAHPRFVPVIESLTPDEAKILEYIAATKPMLPYISVLAEEKQTVENAFASRPVTTVLGRTTELGSSDYLSLPSNAALYFDNLTALGLVTTEEQRTPAGDATYEILRERHQPFIQEAGSKFAIANKLPYANIITTHGYYELTEFGKNFMKACHEGPL